MLHVECLAKHEHKSCATNLYSLKSDIYPLHPLATAQILHHESALVILRTHLMQPLETTLQFLSGVGNFT